MDPKKEFARKMRERIEKDHPAYKANKEFLAKWGIDLKTPSEIKERRRRWRKRRRSRKKGKPSTE